MKKKSYTDSIGVEIEINDENGALRLIEIKEIDQDVFPPLAIDDKTKMAWLVDALCAAIKNILADQRLHSGGGGRPIQGGKGRLYTCEKCGREFEVKQPCDGCSKKTTTEICPGCRHPVRIVWE